MAYSTAKLLAAPALAALLSVGALPVAAQQEGLVNVTIVDLVDVQNANIQVPVGIAANICIGNLSVAALAEQVAAGNAQCDATAEGVANNRQAARIAQQQGIQFPG